MNYFNGYVTWLFRLLNWREIEGMFAFQFELNFELDF